MRLRPARRSSASSCTIPQITSRRPARGGDVDRVGGALVRVDPAQDDQVLAAAGRERQPGQVDAVVDGGHVVQLGPPVDVGNGHVRGRRGLVGRQDRAGRRSRGSVVSSGARQCPAKASGSQSRWLCTRSNSPDRAKACATCSASQTRPSMAGSSAYPCGQTPSRSAGRDRVQGGEQRDVDAAGDQPVGEQAGDLLPRSVVDAAGCARRSVRAARPSRRRGQRAPAARPRRAPAAPAGGQRRLGALVVVQRLGAEAVVAAAGGEVVDRQPEPVAARGTTRTRAPRAGRGPRPRWPPAPRRSASTSAAASSGCSSPLGAPAAGSPLRRQPLPTSRTTGVSSAHCRPYQSSASSPAASSRASPSRCPAAISACGSRALS